MIKCAVSASSLAHANLTNDKGLEMQTKDNSEYSSSQKNDRHCWPIIEIRGLKKSFGRKCVLNGINLDVRRGEFVSILGASGTGKSTFFRCIAGLTPTDEGTIKIQHDPSMSTSVGSKRICFIFQQFNLIKRLSAIDNVLAGRLAAVPFWRVALRCFTQSDRQHALKCLDEVDMIENAYARCERLSGGQQQRVAIARALCQGGGIILADEPIASLDPESASRVLGLLRSVAKCHGITVMCSLHQVDMAVKSSDRILGFRNGSIVIDKAPSEISEKDKSLIYLTK